MGVPADAAHGSLRFSLSRETTREEIDTAVEIIAGVVEKMRGMMPARA
jgi:cysteine desulfurase